jgi:hypothetical protein
VCAIDFGTGELRSGAGGAARVLGLVARSRKNWYCGVRVKDVGLPVEWGVHQSHLYRSSLSSSEQARRAPNLRLKESSLRRVIHPESQKTMPSLKGLIDCLRHFFALRCDYAGTRREQIKRCHHLSDNEVFCMQSL